MIVHEIHHLLLKKKITLSLAESCTGGALSSHIVMHPGCSSYFLGSIVSYSRSSKERLLGVDPKILTSFGEVSSQTAEAMALGALAQFGSTLALSVTGIAGPEGGSEEKPIGTIYFGLAEQGLAPRSWMNHFHGDRRAIINQTLENAFDRLWHHLQK